MRRGLARAIGKPLRMPALRFIFRTAWDFIVARLSTLIALSICGTLLAPAGGLAQADQGSRCFPWQEFRDGICVAKPGEATPSGQSRQLTKTPRDDPPAEAPVTVPPPPPPAVAV